MIKENDIEQLLELDIRAVVEDYDITLKKSGVNYKGLCPFHQDKTPSFVVSPAKNVCKCFSCGEGGNTISFVMKMEHVGFHEACKILAKNHNIKLDIEEKKPTPEEVLLYQKKESAYVIYEHLNKYFVQNLHADTPEAKAALSYAVHRWGMEEVMERGIGYATSGWQDIVEFAKKEGLSIGIMKELDIIRTSEKGSEYGFYRNRLMIPIRDKYGRIESYTARALEEHEAKDCKYLNGADSFLFKKGNTLFGLDIAKFDGAKHKIFYVVEGAPDVIKLQEIGILNTIAALGTSFTKEQFHLLKRFNASLCFIPDADKAGIEAVIKNGKAAMAEGFRVLVKEIPPLEETDENGVVTQHKQDADSYFKRPDEGEKNSAQAQLDAISTEDFVVWLDKHIWNDGLVDTAKSDIIRELADTLLLEKDEYVRNTIVDALAAKHGHKNMWKNAINDAKRRAQEKRAKETTRKSGIDLRKYGFYEDHNSYWCNEEGSEKQWSNFKMKPLYHILGVDDSKRIYEVTNQDGVTRTLELSAEELVSLPKFQIRVESMGNFLWYGTVEELKKLKKYLYDITGTALSVRQYGWQKRGFWAFGNGCIYEDEFIPADHMGIVHLHEVDKQMDDYYLQGASDIYANDTSYFTFERQFIFPEGHSSISLPDFANMMVGVFGNNAKIGICYLLASIFRDIITSYTTNFPILNLFGQKGTGKSELGITLMRFFTIGDEPTNLRNTTAPGLSQLLSMTANSLIFLDEYKNTLDMRIIEIIKGCYDGVGRSRMDMDRGKQIEKTPVDCGVIVGGQEMPTLDIAMFSRMIFLTHDSPVHDREAKDRFNRLVDIRKMGLQHLTKEILANRKFFASSFYETYNEVTNEVFDEIENANVEDRLWRNWVILLSTYKTLYKTLELPFEYEEIKKLCVDGILRQNTEVVSNNEMGRLWDAMKYLFEENMIYEGADFKVKRVKYLKTTLGDREFRTETPILMLRPSHFIGQYRKMASQQKETVMTKDSIKYYLTTSSAYLGERSSERWKIIIDGKPEVEYRKLADGSMKSIEKVKFDRCMCFDYNQLKDKFDLELEFMSGEMADEFEKQIVAEEEAARRRRLEPEIF